MKRRRKRNEEEKEIKNAGWEEERKVEWDEVVEDL